MFIFDGWVQWIGYTGSILIGLSMMMNSIARLRLVNLMGAITFTIYGYLFKAYPVLILNSFIVIVDIFYLIQISRKKDYFELFKIDSNHSPFLDRFLVFYHNDIKTFFPDFSFSSEEPKTVIFVLRNLLPVGLFICKHNSNDTLEIVLDYVVPDYRDLKTAHFFYQRYDQQLEDLQYIFFVTHSNVKKHVNYLLKIGFQKDIQMGANWFKKPIGNQTI